jgi:multicomponent Na+:H+ antiporter subunit D
VSQIPALIPASLLLTGLLALLAGLRHSRWGHLTSLAGAVVAFVLSLAGAQRVISDGVALRYPLGNWLPPIGIEFVLDHLAAFMTVLITFIGVLVLVYAPRSLARETPGKEAFAYPAMALLLAGLTGMSLTGDLFNLYVFLEIAALAAYALLAVGDRGAPVAVFRYLLVGALGGGFYLVGVAFLYFSAGTLNMADLYVRLPELVESRAVVAAAVFMVIGLGVKMALFPMHFWLPDVYTNAPTSVSGLIAPIMTKVSAYAIIRIFISVYPPGFFTEAIPLATTIGWLAAGGILFGSILAVAQQDYRRMLAYSSVGQISYVALGIGLANPIGLIGGLLHILNHALMKGMLFLIAGAVRFRTGVTLIPRMKGLGRKMPWTMAAFVVGALAMVGIPPTAGFFSKWYLLLGALEAGNWWWFGVIIVSSLLSAIYFFRMVEMIYREPDEGEPEPNGDVGEGEGEAPASMLIPILILAVAILGAGLLNFWIVTELLSHAVAGLGG